MTPYVRLTLIYASVHAGRVRTAAAAVDAEIFVVLAAVAVVAALVVALARQAGVVR